MKPIVPEEIISNLRIELESIKNKLSNKDVEQLAKESYMSVSTIYSYLGGKISSVLIAQGIINSANELLANK